MTFEKPRRAGQPAKPVRAETHNNMLKAARKIAEQASTQRLSTTDTHPKPDFVKVRNISTEMCIAGDVLVLGEPIITDLTATAIWLEADIYSGEGCWGVLKYPAIPSDAGQSVPVVDLQISGACLANVNVTSTTHTYCGPTSGSKILQSSASGTAAGTCRILWKPAGTGELVCVVLLVNPCYGLSSGSGCDTIEFQIVSSDPATRTALVEIEARPDGCSDVPESILDGTVVEVCDPQGCYLNEPNVALTGRKGWAKYMMPVEPNICQPDVNYLAAQWHVFALCCETPACEV